MNYLYGQEAPLEEIDEMIAILKAIQKHQREIHLLVQRTQTMCPQLMDTKFHNPLAELLNYKVNSNYFTHERDIKAQLEQLEERKKRLKEQEQ